MRAVVTGGAGFIGSHLIEALTQRGDEVICLERPGASSRWIDGLPVVVRRTGVRDVDSLAEALDGAGVLFHLAGLTEARRAAEFEAVNTLGTECVLQAAARHGPRAPQVVLLSSLAAVGPCRNGDRLGADTAPCPLSPYGRSKLQAEALMHAYADRVPGTIVRLPSVYGPRERGVLTLFKLVQHGFALTIGSWDRQLSLIYVTDVVHGLLAIADHPASVGRTYCLSHPELVSWRRFAETVGRALHREPKLVSVPPLAARVIAVASELLAFTRGRAALINRARVLEIRQARWVCDPTPAIQQIGFCPQFPIARGVPETAAWYREARWL